jgi:hypothetical protein
MLVSTGADATNGFTGSSYSMDGGLNWTDIDIGVQRTALGIADSLTMWAGGFTTSPTADGIFKWTIVPTILCSDGSINPGTGTSTATALCEGDTAIFTTTGVVAPTEGSNYGVSWLISSADITGSSDPLNDPNLVATYTFTQPAGSTSVRSFINDASLITTYGTYYWTPVVYGNASPAVTTPVFLGDLILDPACTYVGASIPVLLYAPGDPNCPTGVNDLANSQIALTSSQKDANTLDVQISSLNYGKVMLSVFDMTGRMVSSTSFNVTRGMNHQSIDATTLAAGTYVIKADFNGSKAQAKVVKY